MNYRVGEHILDPRKFELRKDSHIVPVEPQVLSLLFLLIENRDRLISKDELIAKIWDGRAVSDSAVSSRIKSARQLLGDDGGTQGLIRTVHGKGFRFVGEVSQEADQGPDVPLDSATLNGDRIQPNRRMRLVSLSAIGLVALPLAGILLWRPWIAAPVTVAVVPASASPQPEAIARDLTAKLGMLDRFGEGGARLLDGRYATNADFSLQVDASSNGSDIESSLSLLNRKRELLWSSEFRRSAADASDLRQQMAFSAGAALQCAFDTRSASAPQLNQQTLKIYLNACARNAQASERDYSELRTMFEQVVRNAPHFEPGLRHLLLVQSTIADELTLGEASARAERARLDWTIDAAGRLNPAMPELFVARAVRLPATAWAERIRLADLAVKNGPEDADVFRFRALLFTEVGRMREATDDIRNAVRWNPMSPALREFLVEFLASAGRLPEANQELDKAERLWPGSATVLQARYLLNLRFGDPKEAMRLRDSAGMGASGALLQGSFLEARADPSPTKIDRAIREATLYFQQYPDAIYQLAQAQVAFGRENDLFTLLLNGRQQYRAAYLLQVLFRPTFRKFQHDPRFMQVAARLGLLRYWQSSGQWPDFCFDPDLPYNCKKEGSAVLSAQRA